jgi:hypothetical protein
VDKGCLRGDVARLSAMKTIENARVAVIAIDGVDA